MGVYQPNDREWSIGYRSMFIGLLGIPVVCISFIHPNCVGQLLLTFWLIFFVVIGIIWILFIRRIKLVDSKTKDRIIKLGYGEKTLLASDIVSRIVLLTIMLFMATGILPILQDMKYMLSNGPQIYVGTVTWSDHRAWSFGGILNQNIYLNDDGQKWSTMYHYPPFRPGPQVYKFYLAPHSHIILDAEKIE